MGTLLMKLAGPLQAWGAESRFAERKTRHEPTKSGVVGLLAAALGRSREDEIDDLARMPLAVRIDQPGRYERDFQTAHTRKYNKNTERWESFKSLPLSERYYLSDAIFVVGIKVPDNRIDELSFALLHPVFPLYLGRRSCSPSTRILMETRADANPLDVLATVPWQATRRALMNEHVNHARVACEMVCDDDLVRSENVRFEEACDYPTSFSREHRRYEWRTIAHSTILVPNPYFKPRKEENAHDPMALFEELK